MVASTLLGLSGLDEGCHALKNSISSPEVFLEKVLMVKLQKPMISFIFILGPMAALSVRIRHLNSFDFSGLCLVDEGHILFANFYA